jgi:hypothetical protein
VHSLVDEISRIIFICQRSQMKDNSVRTGNNLKPNNQFRPVWTDEVDSNADPWCLQRDKDNQSSDWVRKQQRVCCTKAQTHKPIIDWAAD